MMQCDENGVSERYAVSVINKNGDDIQGIHNEEVKNVAELFDSREELSQWYVSDRRQYKSEITS